MTYSTSLVTAPSVEPITASEAKAALRVTSTDDDTLITNKIIAAREWIEHETKRALLTQTWDLFLPSFPRGEELRLPFGKLQSISAFEWTDADEAASTWTVSAPNLLDGTDTVAHIDTAGDVGRIVLAWDGAWPSDTLKTLNPVRVRLVCGWAAAASLPQAIKEAMFVLVKDWYDNQQGGPLSEYAERAARYLLSKWRIHEFGYTPWAE